MICKDLIIFLYQEVGGTLICFEVIALITFECAAIYLYLAEAFGTKNWCYSWYEVIWNFFHQRWSSHFPKFQRQKWWKIQVYKPEFQHVFKHLLSNAGSYGGYLNSPVNGKIWKIVLKRQFFEKTRLFMIDSIMDFSRSSIFQWIVMKLDVFLS